MGLPSLVMTDVLEAVKGHIEDNLSAGEKVEIAPALIPSQYAVIKYTVCPVSIKREYTNAQDGSDTIIIPRVYVRVWASVGLVGGTDGSFENVVVGIESDSKKGIAEALEWAEGILRDYFMASEEVQTIKFIYDDPTFVVVDLGNNQTAMAGSFQIEVTGTLTAATETPILFGTRIAAVKVPGVTDVQTSDLGDDTVTISWTTNFPSTSFVEYGAGVGADLSESTTEDTELVTEHEVVITGLSPDTYYEFRPCSRDTSSTRVGKTHDRYSFTTTGSCTAPTVIFGPQSSPSYFTCIIQWLTDLTAYHRVRYRKTGTSEWSVTDWSVAAGQMGNVTLESLDDNTQYDYQVQSCVNGDGTCACDWYPVTPGTFTTLEDYDLAITNLTWDNFGKNVITVSYDTNAISKCTLYHKEYYGGMIWIMDQYTSSFHPSHTHDFTDLTPSTRYYAYISAYDPLAKTARSPASGAYVVETCNNGGQGGGYFGQEDP